MRREKTTRVIIEPLTAKAFEPFGDVIDASGEPTLMINGGNCARFSDKARLNFSPDGQAGISVFLGKPYELPYRLPLLERHPLGSQAFLPMSGAPFLVIVAEDENGQPVNFRAFLTAEQQGVNLLRGVWHGVLTPLKQMSQFAVVDWIGNGVNLEEHHLDHDVVVQLNQE